MISGGHFNPAVTFGFFVTRRISPSLAGFYWLVQLSAATLAALLLKWVLPHSNGKSVDYGAPVVHAGLNAGKGVTIEAVLTFFLVWVIFATAVDPRGTFKQIAGLAIGLTITLDILMGGGLTGAAMNPARAFGTAARNRALDELLGLVPRPTGGWRDCRDRLRRALPHPRREPATDAPA